MKRTAFHKQITGFHCGPASLVGASAVLRPNSKILQEPLGIELGTLPAVGTSNQKLAAWCQTNLPVLSVGENTYKKGLAIANIRNPFSGNGHYVLLLGHDNKHTHYFCPLLNRSIIIPTPLLDWRDGSGTLARWSVNFAM